MRRWLLWILVVGLSAVGVTYAQDDVRQAVVREGARLFAGPGDTFLQTDYLRQGTLLTIVERNNIGNWLHVQQVDGQTTRYDGWVLRGYLSINPNLRFSQLPVNDTIADGDPETVFSPTQKLLIQMPVIPHINPIMELVYMNGQALGNQANVVTKVGDSVIENTAYLRPFSLNPLQLGMYDYLQSSVTFYGVSMGQPSVAAQVGMSSYVIFDPLWAKTNPNCQANETPLACEYRLKKPSVAFIGFGQNDVLVMTDEEFATQMRKIVQESLNAGVIPILSTFSVKPDYEYYGQAMNFNVRLVEISQEFGIPLINTWLAMRPLWDYGLDVDGVHYFAMGYDFIDFSQGFESYRGVTLQNLLAIRMLDEIYRALKLDTATQ
jgi:hypothetical protein